MLRMYGKPVADN